MASYGALKVQETFEFTGGDGIPPPPPPPSTSFITVNTDKTMYDHDSTIRVFGKVSDLIPGTDIALTVTGPPPFDNIIKIDVVSVRSDGTFETTLTTGGELWKYDGTYTIKVTYGTQEVYDRAYVQLSSEGTIPPPPPEPTCVPLSFVDQSKDPQYYLDRYYNEPTYKDWFDTNFPDITIEEGICLDAPGNPPPPVPEKLPEWVRNLFIWYAEKRISEAELLDAIQFLIDQGVLKD